MQYIASVKSSCICSASLGRLVMSEQKVFNAENGIYAVWDTTPSQDPEGRDGILMLADTGVTFQSLLKSAQQGFPHLGVTLTNQLPDDDPALFTPRLILLDALAFRSVSSLIGQCREYYPNTPIALMVEGGWNEDPALRAVVAERAVQGLLPFNLQMNVWLAAVWLLLNGGEYFPSTVGPKSAARSFLTRRQQHLNSDRSDSESMLSTREAEVLEFVSDGLQNKIIAAKMELSEHTVKVHVHNIIRKLKVHNRTQAAAVFRSFDRRSGHEVSVGSQPSIARSS
ncbi:response regulator transcription factor [Devosia rhodophyticola]|uniref:Response regulator transcription factor n=1 Tax=Devosia rhodophyticola TaxID=3026423 RepID=A0ABY7YXX9_9HYPH|nr:response regulator transcription factor [Devosia rhodophyticola]WDR06245.1 response regulator transcription factor [Devosia rhodophyticola]